VFGWCSGIHNNDLRRMAAYRVEARVAAPIGSHIREREFARSFLLLRGIEGKARRPKPTEASNFATRIRDCPGVHK